MAFLARDPRLVLIMHNLRLDLWEVPRHEWSFSSGLVGLEDGTALDSAGGVGGEVQPPVLRLTLEPKSETGGHMACAAISAAG